MKDSATPTFSVSNEGNITITIPITQALLANQGYTYNQSGLTYNQTGVQYGGVYNYNEDVIPSLFVAKLEQPSLNILTDFISLTAPEINISPLELSFTDIYKVTSIEKNISLGPGFFMFITH